jgi:hypothetical protein
MSNGLKCGDPFVSVDSPIMSCDHDLDPEYLYPSDAALLDIFERDDTLHFSIALPCPECEQALKVTARAESIEETDLELPLDDAEERYD